MPPQGPADTGYIVEFIRAGNSVRVMAIDPETGTEAVVVGAPGAARNDLAQLAVRKLRYILARRSPK